MFTKCLFYFTKCLLLFFLISFLYVSKKKASGVVFYTMHRSEYLRRKIKHKYVLYNLLSNFSIHSILAKMEFYLQLRDIKWLDRKAILGFWTLLLVQIEKAFYKETRHFRTMDFLLEQNEYVWTKLTYVWTNPIFVHYRKLCSKNINLRFSI